MSVPTANAVRFSSPLSRAAAQQAPALPTMAAPRMTSARSSICRLFTMSSRVFRPEKVKNMGSRKTTAKDSSCRVNPRVKSPRGMATPRRNPPNTA